MNTLLEKEKKRLQASQQYWDDQAANFDEFPDHGLRDPLIRDTWAGWLKHWLPKENSAVLDIGCGTGSLSVLLAKSGHNVTAIDLSPAMISIARQKAALDGLQIGFQVMDAAYPRFSMEQFDVLLCRHVLWALPEPRQVLRRWVNLLKPQGRIILIEGYWRPGSGLHADEILAMLPSSCIQVTHEDLSEQAGFWGGAVSDERYAIVADRVRE